MRVPGSALAGSLLCAVLFAVLPAPASADPACPDSDTQPTASNLVQVEAATLCLVNVQRTRHGLRALTPNALLQGAAIQHSKDMVDNHFFAHESSSGKDFENRLLRFRYARHSTRFVIGENIAWGTLWLATPGEVVTSWMNSPDHRANILYPDYQELGVGIIASTPSGDLTGATYTTDFGARASRPLREAKKPTAHRKHRVRHRHHRTKRKHRKRKSRLLGREQLRDQPLQRGPVHFLKAT